MTFSVGRTAWLTTCPDGRCRPAVRVGGSALEPQSAVAVQPGTGRTIVLWRGRTSRGVNRLQWRVTTNGRLGATHTLAEFGDGPQLATDASGTTVAAWLGDRRSRHEGVRTAARRVGEFGAPATVTSAPAGALRLVTSDVGSTVAAWLTGPGSANPEQTVGAVQVATRTRTTRFGAPQSLGTARPSRSPAHPTGTRCSPRTATSTAPASSCPPPGAPRAPRSGRSPTSRRRSSSPMRSAQPPRRPTAAALW